MPPIGNQIKKVTHIHKTALPRESVLNKPGETYDYIDIFEKDFSDPGKSIDTTKVALLFFTSSPSWVDKLFSLRNRIMSVFGLKTSGQIKDREQALKNFRCETGEKLGLFNVFYKSENEVILGEDDKHLNFRVSLLIRPSNITPEKRQLTITTAVTFNNWFGKVYFLPVRPFHRVIVPAMMKAIIKKLSASNID